MQTELKNDDEGSGTTNLAYTQTKAAFWKHTRRRVSANCACRGGVAATILFAMLLHVRSSIMRGNIVNEAMTECHLLLLGVAAIDDGWKVIVMLKEKCSLIAGRVDNIEALWNCLSN